jgi:hypothetical protein
MREDVRVSFRLKPGRDDSIIDWLENLSEHDRSYYVREGLRAYLIGQSPQAPSFAKKSASIIKPTVQRTEEKVIPARGKIADSPEVDDKLDENLSSWFD